MQRNRPNAPSNNWDNYVAAFSGRIMTASFEPQARFRRGAASCEHEGKHAFEACPFYLGEVHAAKAIRLAFPHLKVLAVLRNPRERAVSAFNDYVRVGRIRGPNASSAGMDAVLHEKVALLRSGARALESFDMRILSSGVYIHGLRAWSNHWPGSSMLVLRSEDLFGATEVVMGRVQRFLGLSASFPSDALRHVSNRNTLPSKSRPSRRLNATLDGFFAPYNAQLYAWAAARGIPFGRWENASSSGTDPPAHACERLKDLQRSKAALSSRDWELLAACTTLL